LQMKSENGSANILVVQHIWAWHSMKKKAPIEDQSRTQRHNASNTLPVRLV